MGSQKWRSYHSFGQSYRGFFSYHSLSIYLHWGLQFFHGMSYLTIFSSIEEKIHAAVVPSSPDVKHISRKSQVSLWTVDVKDLMQTGFIFSTHVIWPIGSIWERRVSLAMFYKIIVEMWCKWFTDDRSCFGTTWYIVPSNFTIRQNCLNKEQR